MKVHGVRILHMGRLHWGRILGKSFYHRVSSGPSKCRQTVLRQFGRRLAWTWLELCVRLAIRVRPILPAWIDKPPRGWIQPYVNADTGDWASAESAFKFTIGGAECQTVRVSLLGSMWWSNYASCLRRLSLANMINCYFLFLCLLHVIARVVIMATAHSFGKVCLGTSVRNWVVRFWDSGATWFQVRRDEKTIPYSQDLEWASSSWR